MHVAIMSLLFFTDEVSDLETSQMLNTTNAQNLMSTTSDTVHHTQSASIRVAVVTRKELGLTRA